MKKTLSLFFKSGLLQFTDRLRLIRDNSASLVLAKKKKKLVSSSGKRRNVLEDEIQNAATELVLAADCALQKAQLHLARIQNNTIAHFNESQREIKKQWLVKQKLLSEERHLQAPVEKVRFSMTNLSISPDPRISHKLCFFFRVLNDVYHLSTNIIRWQHPLNNWKSGTKP